MTVNGTAPQLFDPTMIPSHHAGSESVIDTSAANPFAPNGMANANEPAIVAPSQVNPSPVASDNKGDRDEPQTAFALRTGKEVDVNSPWSMENITAHHQKSPESSETPNEPTTPEGTTFGEKEAQLMTAQEDLFDPRTGKQTRPSSNLRQAQFDENYQNPEDHFDDRTGQQTDVISDLRNAKFLGATREYEEDGVFYGDNPDPENPFIPINRPPLAVADHNDVTVNVADALGHDDGNPNTTVIVGGTVLANDTDPDGNDTMTITSISGVGHGIIDGTTAGTYGILALNHDGTYTYTLNDTPMQMQALAVGETLTDTFTYTIVDRAGQSSTTTLSIVIHGVNNVPVFTVSMGDSDTAAITETNTTLTATGTLSIGDVDTTDTVTATPAPTVTVGGTYQGALPSQAELIAMFGVSGGEPSKVQSDNPHGIVWTFNSGSHYFDPIPAGETVTLTYTVDATDNHGVTRSHPVTIIITGTNAIPIAVADTNSVSEGATTASTSTISGDVVGATVGSSTGDHADTKGSDGVTLTGVAKGTALPTADLSNANTVGAGHSVAGDYGSVVINADGTYTYTLNNNDVRVQHLASGESLTEIFSYTAKDSQGATATTTLTLTINGTNDTPTITPIDGNTTGNGTHIGGEATVYEAALATGSNPSATTESTNGTLTIAAKDGLTNVIIGGTTITEAQLVAATSLSPITITTLNGSTLNITGFTPTHNQTDGSGHLLDGSGTINYTYTLNSAHTNGSTNDGNNDVTDVIALQVNDRTGLTNTGNLTVTIVDDVPTAIADTNSVSEDTTLSANGNVFGVSGASAGDHADTIGADTTASPITGVVAGAVSSTTDLSNGATVGSSITGTYGSVTINADGTYTYVLDNTNPAVQAIGQGVTKNDIFSYTIKDADGDISTTTLTIAVHGTNDAPVAVADTATATEKGGLNNATAGVNPTGKVLTNDTDVDTGDTKTVSGVKVGSDTSIDAVGNVGATLSGTYGTIKITGAGAYTYTVNNADATVQHLIAGEHLTDTFTYTMKDSQGATSTTTLTVTINGASDTPTITITDHNGAVGGQESVAENATLTNQTFTIAAVDGLTSVEIANTTILEADLLNSGTTPISVLTTQGTMTITGYNASTGVITYDYDPSGVSKNNPNGLLDSITIKVNDRDNTPTSATLGITITDTNPTPHAVTDSIDEKKYSNDWQCGKNRS